MHAIVKPEKAKLKQKNHAISNVILISWY